MKVLVIKTQNTYLIVEVNEGEDPVEKARSGAAWMTREKPATYALQKNVVTSVVPDRDWPLLLRPMKLLAKEGDTGLGDIVERTIGPVGGDAYKIWYKTAFGKTCGCTERKDALNERYPL